MTAAVTPAGALAWLRALSVDVRAAAVLDAEGGLLAGDEALALRAAATLNAAPAAPEVRDGRLVVARSARHAIAVEAGPHVLPGLLACDLRTALELLDG